MRNLKLALQVFAVITATTASAVDVRFGPKVGLGIGSPLGVKEGDTKIAIGLPIGGIVQFDFGGFGIDTGLNYRYNAVGFNYDDYQGSGVDYTYVVSYSSVEIPVTAYAILGRHDRGFWKVGGGAGLDYGFGKVKQTVDTGLGDISQSESFSNLGLRQMDLYLIGHFGYQFLFDSWSLSLDLQPKYGLLDKFKDNAVSGTEGSWHSLWFDFTVGFLF